LEEVKSVNVPLLRMNLLRHLVRFSGRRSFIRLTHSCSCVAAAAQILQINFLDHVIIGQGFFSFQEAGLLNRESRYW
jgi:hypothetical protein